jgi:hypothetical protein
VRAERAALCEIPVGGRLGVNRRKPPTVLVPVPEIFRIGIRVREKGFWVLEGKNGDVPGF